MSKLNWNNNATTFGDINGFIHYGRTSMSSKFKTGTSQAVSRCWHKSEVECMARNSDKYIGTRSSSTAVWLLPEHKHTGNPVAVGYSYAEPVILRYQPHPSQVSNNTFGFPIYNDVEVRSCYKFSPTTTQHVSRVFDSRGPYTYDKPKPNVIYINTALSRTQPQDWIEQMVYDINEHLDKALRCRATHTTMNHMTTAVFWYETIYNVAMWFDVDVDAAMTELGKTVDLTKWGDKITTKIVKWRISGEATSDAATRALGLIDTVKARLL